MGVTISAKSKPRDLGHRTGSSAEVSYLLLLLLGFPQHPPMVAVGENGSWQET